MSSISVSRTESKYFLTQTAASSLKTDLQAMLEPDSFSRDGAYRVKSLYFDSISQRDYLEKIDGIEARRKIRLRVYDEETGVIKLEEKVKHGIYQNKRSVTLARADAIVLAQGDYTVLRKYNEPAAQEMYVRMALGIYRPAVIIEYERCAFVFPEFHTRITIDSNVKSSELDLRLFDKNNNWTFRMNDTVILEVKYDGRLPKAIAAIIAKYALNQIAFGKYAVGRPIFEEIIYA